jgi:ankyrin repeat protein
VWQLGEAKQLVEGGASIEGLDADRRTALMLASLAGHFEIVVYFVEHGANVAHTDRKGMTALLCACVCCNLSLEHGATITERDNDGMIGLLHAAENGNMKVIQYLISSEGGASITETDVYWFTETLPS